jgi:uncharacterized protein (TIGR02271 family)
MATTTGTVVGYFATETQAEAAVTALKAAGFPSSQIGLALNSTESATDLGTTQAQGTATSSVGSAAHKAGEKTASAWDRFKNFFEGGDGDVEPYADERARGNATESHEITGAYGAYGHEDVSHSLTGLNVPEERSRYFGHRFGTSQGAVVTVTAAGREDEAEAILEQNGADLGQDSASYDYNTPVPQATETAGQQRIQLLGEVLRVHKDRVSRGEVTIRKEIITEQQTIQVPVTREELVIERVPVSGTTAAAGAIGDTGEIRIPLSEERATADTQTVVREEIAVGKRTVEDVQEVGGSVRHEEVEINDSTKVN